MAKKYKAYGDVVKRAKKKVMKSKPKTKTRRRSRY